MDEIILIVIAVLVVVGGLALVTFPFHLGWFIYRRLTWFKRQTERTSKQNIVSHALMALVGLVAWAIVIPNVMRFPHHKPMQSEAKTNLGAIFTTQVSYFGVNNAYAGGPNAFKEMKWEPEGMNRYAYFCDGDFIPNKKGDPIPRDLPQLPDGVRPANSSTAFTCMAVGNVDKDSDLDVWTIDDAKQLRNVLNDV